MHALYSTSNSFPLIAERKGVFALFAGLFFLVISLAGYAGLYYLNKSQEDTQAALVQQIQQKEDDLRPKILDQVFMLQKKLQIVSAVVAMHRFAQNTFTLLERDTHPRVRFDSYSFQPTEHSIVLKGEADDYAVLAKQIAFMEGDLQIDSVDFGGLKLNEKDQVSFNLTVHIMPSAIATSQ